MDQLMTTLPRLDFSRQAQEQNAAPAAPAAAPAAVPMPPRASLQLEDPDEYARQYDAYVAQRTQKQIDDAVARIGAPVIQSNAQTARELSMRDPQYADVWGRYGFEIDQEMAQVPMELRTKQAYDKVAQMIRGRHFNELMYEKRSEQPQQAVAATVSSSEQNVPAAQPVERSPLDELFDSGMPIVNRLTSQGLTKSAIRQKLQQWGLSEQEWVDATMKGGTIYSDVDKGGRGSTIATTSTGS